MAAVNHILLAILKNCFETYWRKNLKTCRQNLFCYCALFCFVFFQSVGEIIQTSTSRQGDYVLINEIDERISGNTFWVRSFSMRIVLFFLISLQSKHSFLYAL